ncbi:hypothetical protein D3C81_1746640 [compost metagenome]
MAGSWLSSCPLFSARYCRIAPDSNKGNGCPPGPFGSRMAGILLLALREMNSGLNWSSLSKLTLCGSYARPISSSMIDTLTPLGVGSEYSCRRSGCWAGHLRVMGNALRSVMINLAWGVNLSL